MENTLVEVPTVIASESELDAFDLDIQVYALPAGIETLDPQAIGSVVTCHTFSCSCGTCQQHSCFTCSCVFC